MPDPRSRGRMIRRDASNSKKLAALSPKSLALFLMLIPHFDAHGKMNGDPMFIKSEVVPLVSWMTLPVIRRALADIHACTNVKWFESNGRWWLHSLNWREHQDIRADRLGADSLPSYPSGELRDKSGTTPGEVPLEGEVQGEGEEEVQGEGQAASVGDGEAPRTAATQKDPGEGNGGDMEQVITPDDLQRWGERVKGLAREKQERCGIDPRKDPGEEAHTHPPRRGHGTPR